MTRKEIIEEVLLNRILVIGKYEQTYTGCPNDLINELDAALSPRAPTASSKAREQAIEHIMKELYVKDLAIDCAVGMAYDAALASHVPSGCPMADPTCPMEKASEAAAQPDLKARCPYCWNVAKVEIDHNDHEAPAQPAHSFEATVQPALNALPLESLKDMQAHIDARIHEIEHNDH